MAGAALCCLGIGLTAGVGSGLLTWMVYAAEDAFAKLPFHYMWWPVPWNPKQ
jgi:chloride channel protein, CIC family